MTIRTILCRLGFHKWRYGFKTLGYGIGYVRVRWCASGNVCFQYDALSVGVEWNPDATPVWIDYWRITSDPLMQQTEEALRKIREEGP